MKLEERKDPTRYTAAYPALRDLLRTAALATRAQRICLVSRNSTDDICVTLVDTAERSGQEGLVYEAGEGDISVPVEYRGLSLGDLVFTKPLAPDKALLEAFASSAGFMLGYAGEVEDAARSVQESRVLQELGLQLGEPAELEQLLNTTVKGIRQLLKADYAAVATISPDGSSRWVTMSGNRTDAFRYTVFPPGKGTAARAVATKETVIISDIGKQADAGSEFPVHMAEGAVCAIAVPILRGGTALGAVIAASRTPRGWSRTEIQLASVIGNGAAVAIDQVRQSAAERSQRAFFEKVLENFPGVLVVVSASDLRVVRANRNFNLLLPEPYRGGEPVVGRTLRELSGQNWNERNEQMANMLRDVDASGEAVSFQQYETAAVSGVTTYWNWTAAPVDPLADGEQRLVMFLAQDVTEVVLSQRKEQESIEAARARAEELETVIRQMVDGVIIFDVDGRIVKYNPAGELLLGRHIDVGADQSSSPTRYGLYTMDNQLYRVDQLPSTLALRGEA
ncbi:MAG TPA: GAF domain-containing protein, partial [Chloroflexia bacterium]|nr:GAF domain-containing protein [Chloroflexia bacterium]